MVGGERPSSRGRSIVTLLGEDPELWDVVFAESTVHARFGDLKLMDNYGKSTASFTGRRLIIVATPRQAQSP
jgi:hypothetical protein